MKTPRLHPDCNPTAILAVTGRQLDVYRPVGRGGERSFCDGAMVVANELLLSTDAVSIHAKEHNRCCQGCAV